MAPSAWAGGDHTWKEEWWGGRKSLGRSELGAAIGSPRGILSNTLTVHSEKEVLITRCKSSWF